MPLAFGTVFRDDERVRQLLRDEAPVLAERLGAVRGCAEWVVALHLMQVPGAEYLSEASAAIQALRGEIDVELTWARAPAAATAGGARARRSASSDGRSR